MAVSQISILPIRTGRTDRGASNNSSRRDGSWIRALHLSRGRALHPSSCCGARRELWPSQPRSVNHINNGQRSEKERKGGETGSGWEMGGATSICRHWAYVAHPPPSCLCVLSVCCKARTAHSKARSGWWRMALINLARSPPAPIVQPGQPAPRRK